MTEQQLDQETFAFHAWAEVNWTTKGEFLDNPADVALTAWLARAEIAHKQATANANP